MGARRRAALPVTDVRLDRACEWWRRYLANHLELSHGVTVLAKGACRPPVARTRAEMSTPSTAAARTHRRAAHGVRRGGRVPAVSYKPVDTLANQAVSASFRSRRTLGSPTPASRAVVCIRYSMCRMVFALEGGRLLEGARLDCSAADGGRPRTFAIGCAVPPLTLAGNTSAGTRPGGGVARPTLGRDVCSSVALPTDWPHALRAERSLDRGASHDGHTRCRPRGPMFCS